MTMKKENEHGQVPRRRKIKIKLKRKRQETPTEQCTLQPPPRKKVLRLKIKANGKTITRTNDFLGSDIHGTETDSSDFSTSEDESNYEPVPVWQTSSSGGGKSLNMYSREKRRYMSESEEEEEHFPSGRRKRKRSNIEGTQMLPAYGWKLEIVSIVGNMQKKKTALNLIRTQLQGGFVGGMANAAQKDGFLCMLYDTEEIVRAAGIFHIEHCGKSASYVCLAIFATDKNHQKQGLGRILTAYLLQKSLDNGYNVIVLAREEAVPFWTHNTLGFRKLTPDEIRKYNRPKAKLKKRKEDLIDLIYDGPRKDLIPFALLRFRPRKPPSDNDDEIES